MGREAVHHQGRLSVPIFNMAIYKCPSKTGKDCEAIIRNFIWTGDLEKKTGWSLFHGVKLVCLRKNGFFNCLIKNAFSLQEMPINGTDTKNLWSGGIKKISICCDGASFGNPGVSWSGAVFRDHLCNVIGVMVIKLPMSIAYYAESCHAINSDSLPWALQLKGDRLKTTLRRRRLSFFAKAFLAPESALKLASLRLMRCQHSGVHDLRSLVAVDGHLPIAHLKLILQGKVLHDIVNGDDVYLRLKDGDSLIVAVKPKAPARHDCDDSDEEDDDLKFQMPQLTSWWKRSLFSFLHEKLKLPDILLMAIFSVSLKAWAVIILWFMLAPIAYRWDIGPLYILTAGFSIILFNLGKRQQGDLSAYSIFNEGFRELPGTLNADRLDRDIRAGQF
ncbi:hypothetical protein GIB67_013570 [Kingdonia uniflora]|uniref:SAYSvFN domain-containing protein n=1 Tax=Kingdonia uniflora TaxID=39325 RepID=A0A7J7KUY3_9MAGN|nr:hypothetical protein GIB67_013570 [Kingdonia uniflora]